MLLCNDSLLNIKGGGSISSSWLNSVARLITTVLEWGRTIGSSIYRYKNKNYCH